MPRKTDYSQWDNKDLIAHIEKLEKRKKYGLVRDVQIRLDPARHPLRAGGLGLAEEAGLKVKVTYSHT